jgi:hypothetical protein
MRSLRIREAFAFDGDFAAAGFVELRAEYRRSRRHAERVLLEDGNASAAPRDAQPLP